MAFLPSLPPEARRILDLAREDRNAAREAFAKLPLEEQVALVCGSPEDNRLLELALCNRVYAHLSNTLPGIMDVLGPDEGRTQLQAALPALEADAEKASRNLGVNLQQPLLNAIRSL